MNPFRRIDDRVSVAPQINVEDVAAARNAGFVCVVNNRPDGEAPDEPQGAEIAAACAAAGLAYYAIPVGHDGFQRDQWDAMATIIREAGGPVLAYCRSGTRSCFLWALGEAELGESDAATIASKARGAGYDVLPLLRQLGSR